jgi:glycosyltransferase involved in cell wall biosynthesis
VYRILHLGKFAQTWRGGIESTLHDLLIGLADLRTFRLFKIAARDQSSPRLCKHAGYLEINVPMTGIWAGTPCCPTMPYLIWKLHQRAPFSLVHLHLPNPMAHFASEFLPASVPRVISWHSDVVKQEKWLRLYQPSVNHLLAKSHRVMVANPYLAEKSEQITVARARKIIDLIPYGIDLAYFASSCVQEKLNALKQQFSGNFIIFALGRHVPYKGFSYLIDALCDLPKNIVLLLGGQGPLTIKLKQQSRQRGLEARVYFLGEIPQEDLPAFYQLCQVFCLPSIDMSEAFGLVQVEAMACGKPIVSCAILPPHARVNQEGVTGFVVSPHSAKALAQAIYQLYSSPILCERMGQAAYEFAQQRFTRSRMINQMQQVYEEVLNR